MQKLESITAYQALEDKAFAILRKYPATQEWGRGHLRTFFGWLSYPARLDAETAADDITTGIMEDDQKAFARLFVTGPHVWEPLEKLIKLYKRETRKKVVREAVRLGNSNDLLKLWNRARKKSGLQPIPNAHIATLWKDKAHTLVTSDSNARDIEDLRALLRKLSD